jgi:prepilin peptidase CpaA
MLIYAIFVSFLIACAFYDLLQFRIPNPLVMGLVALFSVRALVQPLPLADIGSHVIVGVAVFVGAAVLFRFGLVGGGDAKLLGATVLWAGPKLFLMHLALTSIVAVGLVALIWIGRWCYPFVVASSPRLGTLATPHVLRKNAGVPYGIAIAFSAILLGLSRAP